MDNFYFIYSAFNSTIVFFHYQIWLSKDNIPVIIHGGDNGELHQAINGTENSYVFDATYEELRSQIDIGDGQSIPTLE